MGMMPTNENNGLSQTEALQRWRILAKLQQNQPILPNMPRSANIFSNSATTSKAFSMLHNVLGAKGNFSAQFSPDFLLKFTNPLEKFLTVKKPLNITGKNDQTINNTNKENEQASKTENKTPVETTKKQPVEIKEKPPENTIPVKPEVTKPKFENKPPIDPRLLGPTCYLIGPSIANNQDLTPKQIQARETAQVSNKEILKKLN